MVIGRHFKGKAGDNKKLIKNFIDMKVLLGGSFDENATGVLTFAICLGFVYSYCSANRKEIRNAIFPSSIRVGSSSNGEKKHTYISVSADN